MATLPQLIEDDIQRLNEALKELTASSEAIAALIIDKGGFLITHQGSGHDFDLTTIAALSSGAFMANQTIAGLVNEPNFNSIYQQGDKFSLFVVNVDENCMLVGHLQIPDRRGRGEIFCLPGRQTHRLPARHRAGTRAGRGSGLVGPQRRRCRGILPPKRRGLSSNRDVAGLTFLQSPVRKYGLSFSLSISRPRWMSDFVAKGAAQNVTDFLIT